MQAAITAYAEFDAVVDYTWIPVNFTGTTFVVTGPSVSLGQLSYIFTQNGGGNFNQTLNSGGTPLAATPSGDGILAIDGFMWVAGDPAEINISSVPEPATLALLGVAAVGLLAYVWRRRAKA